MSMKSRYRDGRSRKKARPDSPVVTQAPPPPEPIPPEPPVASSGPPWRHIRDKTPPPAPRPAAEPTTDQGPRGMCLELDDGMTDITLIAKDGEHIRAHSGVLAMSGSEFFRVAIFESGMRESRARQVEPDGTHIIKQPPLIMSTLEHVTLTTMLKFLYHGDVTGISIENVETIYRAAHMYLLPTLRAACTAVLHAHIRIQVWRVLGVATSLEDAEIVGACIDHIATNFKFPLEPSDTFYASMTTEHMEAFLKSDRIDVADEGNLFTTMISWVHHDRKTRSSSPILHRLLPLIRFGLMEPSKALACLNALTSRLNNHTTSALVVEMLAELFARATNCKRGLKGALAQSKFPLISTKRVHAPLLRQSATTDIPFRVTMESILGPPPL